jgi:glycosyltransferase involved in cell wall biosynthesis
MMNVLILSNSFPNRLQPHRGVYTEEIAVELKKKANITIACPLPWFPKIKLLGKNHHWNIYAHIPREYTWHNFQVFSPKHVVLPKISTTLNLLFLICSLFPTVIRLHKSVRFDAINVHNAFPEGVAGVILGRILKIPTIVTALGSDINGAESSKMRLRLTTWALNLAANITAVSQELCNKMVEMGIHAQKVHYIANGIDRKNFHPLQKSFCRKRLNIVENVKCLLFIGKFRKTKGLDYLIEALDILKQQGQLDFNTFLIGSGPYDNKLKGKITASGLEKRILLVGNQPHSELRYWLGACDVFCLPSLNEGMPNVVLEALACGRPVVATKVGAIPILLSDSNGKLVPPAQANSLANALHGCFKQQWEESIIVASISQFSWKKSAGEYFKIISESIDSYTK